jgi:predicted RNase H-like nuclease
MGTFIGVDLGWYGKPSGLASLEQNGNGLRLRKVTRLREVGEILEWIAAEADGTCVVAVDAPLIIQNQTGIRPAERDLNRDFRRFEANCHAANLGRPFARHVTTFSRRLTDLGFVEDADMKPRQSGRFQIEVHPHAATVNLFGLDRIVKYKRGPRHRRASELFRLRELLLTRLPGLDPALCAQLPELPVAGPLKPIEDQIDAVLCAYLAAHWWHWAKQQNRVYGIPGAGSIVVPERRGRQ